MASAQRKVEARNFDMRKHLLKYDDVMNEQRKIIYKQRKEFMKADDLSEMMGVLSEDVLEHLMNFHINENTLADMWNLSGLENQIKRIYNFELPIKKWVEEEDLSYHLLVQRLEETVQEKFEKHYKEIPEDYRRFTERNTLLKLLDHHWKEHLYTLDQLRQGINLRAYAQSNPLNEYKREAFMAFDNMLNNLRMEIISAMSHISKDAPPPMEGLSEELDAKALFENLDQMIKDMKPKTPLNNSQPKLSRNSPCPCGSGKRFKHCCGSEQ